MQPQIRNLLSWLSQPAHLAIVLVSSLPPLFTLIYTLSYRLLVPFRDEWLLNGRIAILAFDQTLTLDDLLFVHAGHRTLFTNLATAVSTWLGGWNLRIEILLNVVLAFLAFGLFVLLLRRTQHNAVALALIPVSALLFSLYRSHNWWSVRHSHWYFANFFILAALWLVWRDKLNWRHLIFAGILGWCATFSMATGMLVWPTVALVLWLNGQRSWRIYGAWLLFALPGIALYLFESGVLSIGQSTDVYVQSAMLEASFPPLTELVGFILLFVGSGIVFDPTLPMLTGLAGVLGIGLFIVHLVFLARLNFRWQQLAPWVGIAAYALASAAVSAIGRIDRNGVGRAVVAQYVSVTSLFWATLAVLFILLYLCHRSQVTKLSRAIVSVDIVIGTFLFGLFIYSTYNSLQDEARTWNQQITLSASEELRPEEQCVQDYIFTRETECLEEILGMPEMDVLMLDALAARGLTIFSSLPRVNVLSSNHGEETPVIIATEGIWQNMHIRDYLLDGISESQQFHIVADPTGIETPFEALPVPLRRVMVANPLQNVVTNRSEESLSAFREWLDDAPTVWWIETQDAEPLSNAYQQSLNTRDYTAITRRVHEPMEYTLIRYERLDEFPETLFTLDDTFELKDWSVETRATEEGCTEVALESLWSISNSVSSDSPIVLALEGENDFEIARVEGTPAEIETSSWQQGRLYEDRRTITIPCENQPGDYPLFVGMGEGVSRDEMVYLTTVHAGQAPTRLFDNGLLIEQQPGGDVSFSTLDGCIIGTIPQATLGTASLDERYLVEEIARCEGYRVEIWSLGSPACQLQANLYGPDEYNAVYQFERQPNDPRCEGVESMEEATLGNN